MAIGSSPEWLNQNALRAFPLAENSSRLDVTGSIQLPNSLIVAAQINYGRDYADGSFFISEISVAPDAISLTVAYLSAAAVVREIATVTVITALHTENSNYAFVGQDGDSSIIGSLTIGNLSETFFGVPGLVEFLPGATPFEVNAQFISVPALRSVDLYNGNTLVNSFGRILKLRQGTNIRLSYVGSDTIRIDAINGENLVTPDLCSNTTPRPACIRTINGIEGDDDGNIQLEGSTCIDVSPSGRGLSITDLCSTSCCGCSELESLVASLQEIEAQVTALRNQVLSVSEQQATMLASLVANLN